MKNQYVEEALARLNKIHDKKNEDYTTHEPDENFKRAQIIASWFKHDRDKVYATLIGVKLARLATLLSKEGIPNNESIEDTFDDQAMYTILWGARYRRDKVERNQTPYLNPGGDLDQKSSFYPNANEFK